MNIIALLKYIIQAASYGVLLGLILILLFPSLREQANIGQLLTTAPRQAEPLSYARAVNAAAPAVVNIYSEETSSFGSRNISSLGSGVIMDSEGYILTNFHVVQNAELINVVLQSGQIHFAELIGFDLATDLAVLKVNATNLPVIPQQANIRSHAGDVVLAIGNPFNLGQTVTQGIVSGIGRNGGGLNGTNYLEFIQMDAAINEGNSGGALINSNGVLVGINSRQFTRMTQQRNIQGIFFAVPYQLAHKVMTNIIENGRVVRGWLGITATDFIDRGLVIDGVAPQGPARKAGLRPGDIIHDISGNIVTSLTQALNIVADTRPNTELVFKVYRGNQTLNIPVLITEYQG